jgi:hypothetical protein
LNGDKAVSAISVTTEPVPTEGMTIQDGQPNRSDLLIEEAKRLFNTVPTSDPDDHCPKIEHASLT